VVVESVRIVIRQEEVLTLIGSSSIIIVSVHLESVTEAVRCPFDIQAAVYRRFDIYEVRERCLPIDGRDDGNRFSRFVVTDNVLIDVTGVSAGCRDLTFVGRIELFFQKVVPSMMVRGTGNLDCHVVHVLDVVTE